MNETGKQGYNRTETVPTRAQIKAAATAFNAALRSGLDHSSCLIAAITAAAEAGDTSRHSVDFLEGVAEGKAATIERCAQVAEKFPNRTSSADRFAIAAAIRALKDSK